MATPIETIVNAVVGALSNYPILEAAVSVVVVLAGLRVVMAGRKDGPIAPPPHSVSPEYPTWLLSGPIPQALHNLNDTAHNNRLIVEMMGQLCKEQREQTALLEMIYNENIINPRRLQQ